MAPPPPTAHLGSAPITHIFGFQFSINNLLALLNDRGGVCGEGGNVGRGGSHAVSGGGNVIIGQLVQTESALLATAPRRFKRTLGTVGFQ